ncbi:hypothetical protein [Yersinia phage vB_YenP_ISAO8]|uniref:Uncharacterized protein n=1 Tax=Yersinia phage vB_YenP_ISAO8 TaxID=1675027 RepID=A0A0H4TJY5_9CAUD|nr:host range and adsorption protein [Yersinia phage vB_YenP_ISAO8]AKQ07692.1 hypothetical protein [Yersinia phage vB_YenP_ISAO8]
MGLACVSALAEDTFDPLVQLNIRDRAKYVRDAVSLVLNANRVEYYLVDNKHNVIGAVIYESGIDIHYGLVATPISVMLLKNAQHDRGNLKAVSQMINEAAAALNCQYYYTVKHTAPGVQVHRLREVRNNG